ncbi:MCE family protein [[Mycobacterium] burgundiense]|uniref:MCE family protein n=1 Tax=[Mycobacterium] burgundiense TaxID=3064286 RepID=A0ABM9LB61_9MYCO|nr:MCE family protein [Mycolicibacterium sp. MU0053]CAJ1496054.1 MCE family protein [Mycolicibacterium sp. MU0053]
MKAFSQYNPKRVGAVGCLTVALVVGAALQYDRLPFFNQGAKYTADFAEAGGLSAGDPVHVAGYRVGQVSDIALDGPRVRVNFSVDKGIRLGDRTEAAIKTETLLGSRLLEVSPRGETPLSGAIPLDRTTSPYELPEALGTLSDTIEGLDTAQLNDSLTTLAETFKDTPANLQLAVNGIGRFSETMNKRDTQLRSLLSDANNVTGVLRERSDEIVKLIADSNGLLAQLRTESGALSGIASNVSLLAQQVTGVVAENKDQLRPALEKLNGVLAMVDDRQEDLSKSIGLVSKFSLSLGESVSGGPFFKEYIANLVPGQFMQPFVEAAFSDLGLDPSVLLPSELTDPQVGQPATPALPVPFPRTGQGGEPRQTLPDAITGNPDDPRYPLRPEPAQPAPGGPAPGPPEGYDPHAVPTAVPTLVEPTPRQLVPPMPGETQ